MKVLAVLLLCVQGVLLSAQSALTFETAEGPVWYRLSSTVSDEDTWISTDIALLQDKTLHFTFEDAWVDIGTFRLKKLQTELGERFVFLPSGRWSGLELSGGSSAFSAWTGPDDRFMFLSTYGRLSLGYLSTPLLAVQTIYTRWDRLSPGRSLLFRWEESRPAFHLAIDGLWGDSSAFRLHTALSVRIGPFLAETEWGGRIWERSAGFGVEYEDGRWQVSSTYTTALGSRPAFAGEKQQAQSKWESHLRYTGAISWEILTTWTKSDAKQTFNGAITASFDSVEIGLRTIAGKLALVCATKQAHLTWGKDELSGTIFLGKPNFQVRLTMRKGKTPSLAYRYTLTTGRDT
ncbi:MAG: hypothetical protein AB7C91_05860 [Sphaerochaeta sp.]|uniref:hypothetical protein n=1 Tax=Sphaerochaeta sp. TaxID=1972642 RepID=UPI003D0CE8FC